MIYINGTGGIVSREEAAAWLAEHVVISRRDLKRIAALCKRSGIYDKLKRLGIESHDLTSSRDEEIAPRTSPDRPKRGTPGTGSRGKDRRSMRQR